MDYGSDLEIEAEITAFLSDSHTQTISKFPIKFI